MNPDNRKSFIGGSDIAAVMGLSRWKTPLAVWAEKTGKIVPKDISNLEHVEIGTELEEYVANKFSVKSGFKVRRDSRTFMHTHYPYMVGHIDRWIVGEDALLECKTTSAWMAKEWEGEEMPREYILQVIWYLGLVGKSLGYVACLIGGQHFSWKQIPFDPVLFEKMVEAAKIFWKNNVLADVAPVATSEDSDTLNSLYPGGSDDLIKFQGEEEEQLNALIEERQGGLEQLKLVQEEVDKLGNQIKQALGEAAYGQTNRYQVSWKSQSRTMADSDKMKDDGIFEKYSKTSVFKVLRTKQLKG